MKLVESCLKFLAEKEWDEDPKWEDHISLDMLKQLIMQDIGVEKPAMQRQSMQPTLLDLIKNTGGDYHGRTKTRNAGHGDFAGIEYILKQMPDDWREKVKQYVETIAKKHKE